MSKYELLDFLAERGDADAHEVARAFDLPYEAAAMALLRLTRQGLVLRHIDLEDTVYVYALSDRGTERLTYFNTLDDFRLGNRDA